jgi:hypothetical protein
MMYVMISIYFGFIIFSNSVHFHLFVIFCVAVSGPHFNVFSFTTMHHHLMTTSVGLFAGLVVFD